MINNLRKRFWNYPYRVVDLLTLLKPLPVIVLSILFTLYGYTILNRQILEAHKFKNSYTEGVVGELTGTNPIFTTYNPVDRSLFNLIFLKLVDINDQGEVKPEIAKSYEISSNGLEYTFYLNNNLYWSDGEQIDADDVVYTFNTAIDLARNNARDTIGSAFDNVKVVKVDNYTVKFILNQKNASFLELVSTYIVPEHIFSLIENNRLTRYFPFGKVVSSGKYKIINMYDDKIILKATSSKYSIQNITLRFFKSEEELEYAFRTFELDAVYSFNTNQYKFSKEYSRYNVNIKPLDYRIRLIYFNLRNPKLESPALRNALANITDKETILREAKLDEQPVKGPIPEVSWAFNNDLDYPEYDPIKAQEVFADANYIKNKTSGFYESNTNNKLLTLELTYLDNDINKLIAESLKQHWKSEGVILNLRPLSYEQITKEILPTRDFELLLYQVELTVDPDQYDLWHSLKADYPSLNISGYNFARIDILLEKARTEMKQDKRKEYYYSFQKYLIADMPVLFLSKVNFVYIYNQDLKGVNFNDINYPYERFDNIEEWYWK